MSSIAIIKAMSSIAFFRRLFFLRGHYQNQKSFIFYFILKMESEDEDIDLMLLGLLLLTKKKQRKKRRFWVKNIYKVREEYGIKNLVKEMQLSNRESYFK